jgi:XTP/dITP diphosphohydrolase
LPKLLIGTNNVGKLAEFRSLLADCGWELVSPPEAGIELQVGEGGRTYSENARIKALAFCEASGLPTLADDSGLEVDALDGEPGPLHHIRGWDGDNNDERLRLLLDHLKDVPEEKRTAHFRIVLAVVFPDGRILEEEATCQGLISRQRSGIYGFGYDPIFYLPEKGKTFAQLTTDEKNEVSHRARAARAIGGRLRALATQTGE